MIHPEVLEMLSGFPTDKRIVAVRVIEKFIRKVEKGIRQHGEDAKKIKNLEELQSELLDGAFYTENQIYQSSPVVITESEGEIVLTKDGHEIIQLVDE